MLKLPWGRRGRDLGLLSFCFSPSALILRVRDRIALIGLSSVGPSTVAAARDLGAGPLRAFIDVTLPLMRGSLVSSFVFAFLLSLNEHARAYFLAGRQNTLPLYMFGAMNSGASPTIYAFSGVVLVVRK